MNRAQYEEQQKKTDELIKNEEKHTSELENYVEMLKNAQAELEEKDSLLQRKEREISE